MVSQEAGEVEQSSSQSSMLQPIVGEVDAVEESLYAIAQKYGDNTIALLLLLRRLEAMHGHIRDGLFQASLPNNRQQLYALLKDIELEGGWPYIPRMKLERLLAKFPNDQLLDDQVTSEN